MIFVNDLWSLTHVPRWLLHTAAEEDGMGLSDVVFPAFLFIVGLSIPHALKARLEKSRSKIRCCCTHQQSFAFWSWADAYFAYLLWRCWLEFAGSVDRWGDWVTEIRAVCPADYSIYRLTESGSNWAQNLTIHHLTDNQKRFKLRRFIINVAGNHQFIDARFLNKCL